MAKLNKLEVARRTFHTIMNESFVRLYEDSIEAGDNYKADNYCTAARSFLYNIGAISENMTIGQIKTAFTKADSYILQRLMPVAEAISKDVADDAEEAGIDAYENITLNDAQKAIVDNVLTSCTDEDIIEKIRSNVRNAFFAENERAEELKRAKDLVSAQDLPADQISESISTLERGPKSLLHAIIHNHGVKLIKENAGHIENKTSVATLFSNKKESVREDAMAMMFLFETAHCFGFKEFTKDEIKNISNAIYLEK